MYLFRNSNFNDRICTSIIPSNSQKECIPEGTGTSKRCVEETLKCEKFKYIADCLSLAVGDSSKQRCVIVDRTKCETHYMNCADATSEEICNKNIPNNNNKKCKWSSNRCQETERTCDDFITFTDDIISQKDCPDLNNDDNKVCFLDENSKCHSYYKQCEHGTRDNCETIKPFIEGITHYDKDSFNLKAHCVWKKEVGEDTESCHKENYKCNEAIGEKFKDLCPYLEKSNTHKACIYDRTNKRCTEIYSTCQSYTDDTSVTTKDPETCKNIKIDDHYTCTLQGNSCIQKKKECKEITEESVCTSHTFDFSDDVSKQNKQCIFLPNNTCVETYKTCSDYQNDATITDKLKNICEIIPPFTEIDNGKTFIYNCTFDSQNRCQRNKIECEYYKGNSDTCDRISINFDDTKYQCKSNNGKCFKQFKTCDDFNYDNPDNDDIEQNKANCLSIILSSPNEKCYLEHDKTCKLTTKLCSEYLGDDEYTCEHSYAPSSDDKQCSFVNNKCTEIDKVKVNPEEYYYYCSDYRGTDKTKCESILPHSETNFDGNELESIDFSAKCVYDTNIGCIRKRKECSEAKSEYECQNISPEDTDQQCAYINNNCIQQYRSCSLYENKVGTAMTKNGCENIKISENTYSFFNSYCEYTENSGTKTCTRKARECKDLSSELLQNIVKSTCSFLTITDVSKKCVYNNNNCVEQVKTCKELSYFPSVPGNLNSICENAPTSSNNKVCKKNHFNSGCEERDPDPDSSNTGSNGSSNDGKRIFTSSKIIFALILLVF